MRKLIIAKASEVFPAIQDIFDETGSNVRITVSGDSMLPFLRDGIDSVELSSAEFSELKKLDIALIKRVTGEYVLHRVVRKDSDCFFIAGDAQQWIEGPLRPEQLQASVSAIWRRNKRISCDSKLWRLCSRVWLLCLPFRYFILRLARIPDKLRRVVTRHE